MKTALVTGSAGFIGYHVSKLLLEDGYIVVGIDNMSNYYDVNLKRSRRDKLKSFENYIDIEDSIERPTALSVIFDKYKPKIVIHLAAQAGVRYSIDNPRSYLESNIVGTFEVLEAARQNPPKHLLLASTSSAYGANSDMPYCEKHKSDHQMSFYAATKKSTEVMAHSYAHIYNIPITMFRFFTVYGPFGRPDMALFKFTKAILEGSSIDVYNNGNMKRDFTYIDDLTHAISLLIKCIPSPPTNGRVENDSISPVAPWRIVNIGNSQTVQLMDFITSIEDALGITAKKNMLPMQLGDVPATWADASLLTNLTGYAPKTGYREGVGKFVSWYRGYYSV